ncbi:universal stress protein [Maribacter aestuarii]|uniref:universal stress protein n=1 Tax=Maribacter aestuarii TaxID=1130723 RepID=UPI003D3143A2
MSATDSTKHEKFQEYKKIVYATDFEEDDILAIQRLVEIAQPLNAEINVVHISTKDELKGNVRMEWLKKSYKKK